MYKKNSEIKLCDLKLYIVAHIGSGGKTGHKSLKKTIKKCIKSSIEFEYFISEYKGHTIKLVQDIARRIENDNSINQSNENSFDKLNKVSKLLIIGGDGTLSEAISSLKKLDIDIPIAYLPSGTGNDFSREVKYKKDVDSVISKLQRIDIPTEIEIIKFTNLKDNSVDYAVNSVGFGFDALIIYLSEKSHFKTTFKKIGIGKLSYIIYIFEALINKYKFSVNIYDSNSKKYSYDNLLIACLMNHPYIGGGVKLDPYLRSNDHKLSIIIGYDISIHNIGKIIYQVLKTSDHIEKNDNIVRLVSDEFTIENKLASHIQVDGESWNKDIYKIHFKLDKQKFWI